MRILPALAAAQLGVELVGNPRGRVVHLTTAGLTPTGRLRRSDRPRCGQRARALRRWPIDARLLCARCARHAPVPQLGKVDLPVDVASSLLARTLATTDDLATVAAARIVACTMATAVVDGRHLSAHVRDAQRRIAGDPVPLADVTYKVRNISQRSRRAQAQARLAQLVDLAVPGA